MDIVNTFISHQVYKNREDNLSKHHAHYKIFLCNIINIITTLLTFFFRGNSIVDSHPPFFSWYHLKALCTMITELPSTLLSRNVRLDLRHRSHLETHLSTGIPTEPLRHEQMSIFITNSPFSTNSCRMMS